MANREKSVADPYTRFSLLAGRCPQFRPQCWESYPAGYHRYSLCRIGFRGETGWLEEPKSSHVAGDVPGVTEFLSPLQFTGFLKTSADTPVPKIAIAFRSLTDTQIFPFWSKAMPSAPSRRGSARKM